MDYSNLLTEETQTFENILNNTNTETQNALLAFVGTFFVAILLIALVVCILQIVAMWKMFNKAGEKGWKSIIPIYGTVVLFKISGTSPWLILLCLLSIIPIVGPLVIFGLNIYLSNNIAKSFGKDIGYTVGLIFLPFIFQLILGLGSAEYVGPAGKTK